MRDIRSRLFTIKITNSLSSELQRSPRKRKESQPRQTIVVKTGSDGSTAKHSAIGLHSLVNSHFRCITSGDNQDLASISKNRNYAFSLVSARICFVFGCYHQGLRRTCKMFRFPSNPGISEKMGKVMQVIVMCKVYTRRRYFPTV